MLRRIAEPAARLMQQFVTHGRRWINNAHSRIRFKFNRLVHRPLIIQSGYAGLGDNLFLSHIPRIAKESGKYEKVLVSNHSVFRDPAFRMLVWESNRYVDGFSDEPGFELLPPHAHDPGRKQCFEILCKLGLENRITHLRPGCNLLDEFMLGMGLDDGARFHDPELYLDIPRVREYENLVVYDPNYITNVGAVTPAQIQSYFDRAGIRIQAQMAVRNSSVAITAATTTITTKSLVEFCSVILSCKALYCLTTGTATLAAALKKPCTVLYGDGVNALYHHSRMHRYVSV
jgi:hypothetical protein